MKKKLILSNWTNKSSGLHTIPSEVYVGFDFYSIRIYEGVNKEHYWLTVNMGTSLFTELESSRGKTDLSHIEITYDDEMLEHERLLEWDYTTPTPTPNIERRVKLDPKEYHKIEFFGIF